MTATELRKLAGATTAKWAKWLKAGLPVQRNGRVQTFDVPAVAAWLAACGEIAAATAVYPGQVATTRDAAAQALGVDTRTLASWMKLDGFPGRAGRPGKGGGWFPIESIEAWRQANVQPKPEAEGNAGHKLYWSFKGKEKQLDWEERLGHILLADDVERFMVRTINTAKAVLEPLPDKIVAMLPAKTPPAVRTEIRKRVAADLRGALDVLAELLAGDAEDDEED